MSSSSIESPAPSTSKPTFFDRKRKSYHEEYDSDSEQLGYDSDSDSCSDDEFENFDKPQTSFGSMVDNLVTKKLRNKILSNRFVEMAELLPGFQTKLSNEYVMKPGRHNNAKLLKCRPRYHISFNQWSKGFDVYMSVYVDKAYSVSGLQKLVKSMLTYRKGVTNLHELGHDWQGYDRHYPTERENNPVSWSTVRPDLQLKYHRVNTTKQSFRPNPSSKSHPNKTLRTLDGNTIPYGHCMAFHSRNGRCEQGNPCTYSHKCPKCPVRHPIY